MMDVEGIGAAAAEPLSSDSDEQESIAIFMQDYLIHDELRERDVWEDITYFMEHLLMYDPRAEEALAWIAA